MFTGKKFEHVHRIVYKKELLCF